MTDAKIEELQATATKLAEVAEKKLQAFRNANAETAARSDREVVARDAYEAARRHTGEARDRERTASIAADRARHKAEAARVAVEKAVRVLGVVLCPECHHGHGHAWDCESGAAAEGVKV